MTETLNDARHAICYIGDDPHLELAADIYTYPVLTPDEQFTLYVSMRAYKPFAVKKFYDQCIPKRIQRSAAERTVETPDYSRLREFVMEHFVGMAGAQLEDGSEPTIEQQRSWLRENPAFQERIFRSAIDAVGLRARMETAGGGKAILVFGQRQHRVLLEFRLYSPERKSAESIRITAVVERLTQSQKHQYDKAISLIENSRRGEIYQESNWDVIEQLANHSLLRLDGPVVYNGSPCTEENKESWLPGLPYLAKVYCMAQAVQEIDIKNA
mgnify:CR=1 FL=1